MKGPDTRPDATPDRPTASRQPLVDAITAILALHGLPAGSAEVSLRSYGGTDGDTRAMIVFVRLNEWKPDALLNGKVIEKRLRDTLYKAMKVRIGYVYWRIGADVATPSDHTERFHVRAPTARLKALERDALAAGALPPPQAPITDWIDLDEPPS